MPVFNLTGRLIGGYVLHEEIGHGGMAAVYRGVQPSVKREVAVKIIQIFPTQIGEEFVKRFEREAELVASLEHIHILPVYDYGIDKDIAFIAMRYLRGGTLRELINGEPVKLVRAADLLTQTASALAYAHRRHVIHRDVKPSNILLDDVGNAFLSDFGLAKWMDRSSDFTKPESVVGTLAYISPEQVMGARIDQRSDIYSLGIVLYDMLTGRTPFDTPSSSAASILHHHLHTKPEPPSATNPDVTAAVDAVVLRALEKKPDKRFETADKFAEALNTALGRPTGIAYITPSSSQRRRVSRQQLPLLVAAAGFIAAVVLGVIGIGMIRTPTATAPMVRAGEKGAPADVVPSASDVTSAVQRLGTDGFVALIACNQTSEYHATQAREIVQMSKDVGITVKVYDSDSDPYKQVTQLERARTDGADAFIVCLLDPQAMDQALDDLQKTGAPLVFFNPAEDNLHGGVGLAQDEFEVGRAAGRFAGQVIQDEFHGQARVIILDYPDLPSIVRRANGIEVGIGEMAPDAVIIGRFAGGTIDLGHKSVADLISRNVKFDVIASINDAGAFGAIDAMTEASFDPASVAVIGVDAESRTQEYLRSGRFFRGSLSVDRTQLSRTAVDVIILLLAGKSVPELIVVQPGKIITKYNLP